MKSGTSSVHRYLGQHPAVFTSTPKELDFFTRNYQRGPDWYMRKFRGAVSGETSPNYMKLHRWPRTPARIRKHVPDARLLCVLRNPIDRVLSHYLHNVWRGRESRPFSAVVESDSNFMMTSRYGWQLERYLAHFPADRLMLVTTEELGQWPDRTMRRILRFLGVDDTIALDTSERHNATSVNLGEAGTRVPADPGISVTDEVRLTAEARARLALEFGPDVEKLKRAWPDFPGWSL
jgi:Sulfotransferase family